MSVKIFFKFCALLLGLSGLNGVAGQLPGFQEAIVYAASSITDNTMYSNGRVTTINSALSCSATNEETNPWIVIDLEEKRYFNRIAVQAFLTKTSVADYPNAAKGKPSYQSSTYGSGQSHKAVDGCMHTSYTASGCGCTETNYEAYPWWSVDLQADMEVHDVSVTNRGDCCGGRLRNFEIIVSKNSHQPDTGQSTRCAYHSGSVSQGATKKMVCTSPIIGRYVIIKIDGTNERLTLCEVQVHAKISTLTNDITAATTNIAPTHGNPSSLQVSNNGNCKIYNHSQIWTEIQCDTSDNSRYLALRLNFDGILKLCDVVLSNDEIPPSEIMVPLNMSTLNGPNNIEPCLGKISTLQAVSSGYSWNASFTRIADLQNVMIMYLTKTQNANIQITIHDSVLGKTTCTAEESLTTTKGVALFVCPKVSADQVTITLSQNANLAVCGIATYNTLGIGRSPQRGCPMATWHTGCQQGVIKQCNNDSDCTGTKVCCETDCSGSACMELEAKNGTCGPDVMASCSKEDTRRCILDKDCSGDLLCCRTPCAGSECRPSGNYSSTGNSGSSTHHGLQFDQWFILAIVSTACSIKMSF